MMKILHGVWLAYAVAVAYLQLNDPDPALWVLFYLLLGVPSGLALVNKRNMVVNYLAIAFCVFWLGVSAAGMMEFTHHLRDDSLLHGMSPDKPYIEQAREFLGAVIALVVMCLYQWGHKLRRAPLSEQTA